MVIETFATSPVIMAGLDPRIHLIS